MVNDLLRLIYVKKKKPYIMQHQSHRRVLAIKYIFQLWSELNPNMIRQHYLQQERLKQNHERLLQRYQRILIPPISEFRPFGASPLPGRNYQQYLTSMNGKPPLDGNHLAIFSRQRIISNNREIDRWIEKEQSESLPKNVNALMQHTRHQSIPLVEAEKFEPVLIYNHPLFGPTPAYIKPIFKNNVDVTISKDESSDSDSNEDDDTIVDNVQKQDTKKVSENMDADEENDSDENAPIGYISHKKWKAKYQNLVPVNPLLFNIHTQRSNESIQSYGRSLYSSLNHLHPRRQRQLSEDDALSTRATLSDVESSVSDIQKATSSSTSSSRYNRLNPMAMSRPISSAIKEESSEDESDDDEDLDTRVPYLSKNNTTLPISNSTIVNEPIKPSSSLTLNPPEVINVTTPAAPPPLPPPMSIVEPKAESTNIPKAPPLPASLTGAPSYQNASNLLNNGNLSNSIGVYQATSSASGAGSTTGPPDTSKTVTFPNSLAPAPPSTVDILSSSDSDDDDKTKKLKRRQKRKAAGIIDGDSSSSDD